VSLLVVEHSEALSRFEAFPKQAVYDDYRTPNADDESTESKVVDQPHFDALDHFARTAPQALSPTLSATKVTNYGTTAPNCEGEPKHAER